MPWFCFMKDFISLMWFLHLRQRLRKSDLVRRPEARQLHFHFLRSPVEVLVSPDESAAAVNTEIMQLQQADSGRTVAVGTGYFESIAADLVLVSIGYRPQAIGGAGFDASSGVILNRCTCASAAFGSLHALRAY